MVAEFSDAEGEKQERYSSTFAFDVKQLEESTADLADLIDWATFKKFYHEVLKIFPVKFSNRAAYRNSIIF